MSYIKSIPISIYKNWNSYQDWNHQFKYRSFHQYLKEKYAEYILHVGYTDKFHQTVNMDRTFTFKSEEHYTWFLLQQ